jgi:hypothetical protein
MFERREAEDPTHRGDAADRPTNQRVHSRSGAGSIYRGLYLRHSHRSLPPPPLSSAAVPGLPRCRRSLRPTIPPAPPISPTTAIFYRRIEMITRITAAHVTQRQREHWEGLLRSISMSFSKWRVASPRARQCHSTF